MFRFLCLVASVGPLLVAEHVFVYAQRETPAKSWLPVICDGGPAAQIRRGYFFAIDLAPGRHWLAPRDGVPVSIDVRPDAEMFVRLNWSHDLRRSPIPALGVVPAETAILEMRFLRYVDTKRVEATQVSRTELRPRRSQDLKRRTDAAH